MDDAEHRFTALYEAHYQDVARYVRRRASDVDVADVLAKVFLVAWRRRHEVPDTAALPWLYRTAANVLANEIRGRQRAARLTDKITHGAGETEKDHADHVVERVAVLAEFDRLEPRDQEILRLIAWEGLSIREAAIAIGLGRTTVAMRVRRLRHRFSQFHQPDDRLFVAWQGSRS
jgi:RNA polymerase sigma factor (sigma-70 family)